MCRVDDFGLYIETHTRSYYVNLIHDTMLDAYNTAIYLASCLHLHWLRQFRIQMEIDHRHRLSTYVHLFNTSPSVDTHSV